MDCIPCLIDFVYGMGVQSSDYLNHMTHHWVRLILYCCTVHEHRFHSNNVPVVIQGRWITWCKGKYTCARLRRLTCGDWVDMVSNVDSSDCRCRCIGKIIVRNLRLMASRLYTTWVTHPWTRHVQPCRYIIPLSRCRPPGLRNPVP